MKVRLNPYQTAPDAMKPFMAAEAYLKECGLEHSLIELIKMRASQINGCAFCLDMHSRDARKAGESEERLYMLNAWHESSRFTPRERAALAWTEAVTLIAETHAPGDVYDEVKAQFTDKEIVDLTLLIATINGWNRIAIATRMAPMGERDAH